GVTFRMNSDVGLGIFSRGRLTRFSPCSLSKTRILAPGDCARHVMDAIKQSAVKSFFIVSHLHNCCLERIGGASSYLPSADQSLDRSRWPMCSTASWTSGTRPARKMKLCCSSKTECTIVCLAYSRTDVS